MSSEGLCLDEFAGVRAVFDANLASGVELGASLCVVRDGETVVDLWGGYADANREKHWGADTLVNVFSVTKTMTALSALLLIDRGELDPHRPVAHYWPEFAAEGKGGIEIRHLLSHTSGVSGWNRPIELADIYDVEAAADRLAAQAPWWEPGTASGYHALTYGHLIDAVIRRITGRSLGRFFAEELAGPLGADFHIGTGTEHFDRIATLVPPPRRVVDRTKLDPDSISIRTLTAPVLDIAATSSPQWRQAELGAVNGHGNARSIARVQSIVSAGGEVSGRRLLSERTLELIFEQHSDGVDLALGVPVRFGLGYGLSHPRTTAALPAGRVCWWAGYGGALVVNDLDRRITVGYSMNRMGPSLLIDERADACVRAVYAAMGVSA
ncbi:putative beta-lactamase [Nocardia nova SH22a]|uniref:Putative beta-lactamase n=1 Tax=Nocardia nova SH22a TaxID=1415166 RepID=W5TG61_9NOCA|nr:EstA family serine hydrolase [Nocardia nova]AHH16236.1 putative beta-lactamase [Nocardia nova SH22a]